MVSGAPHGHGKKTFPNGDIYDGQFKKDSDTDMVLIDIKRFNIRKIHWYVGK